MWLLQLNLEPSLDVQDLFAMYYFRAVERFRLF